MANGYSIPVLSGLLRGLSGLPEGMDQADRVNAEQARLAEQQRQFDEGRFTDISTLAPILKAGGYDTSTLPAGRVPNTILPTMLNLGQKKAETERKTQLGQDLSQQLLQQGTSVGLKPDTTFSMPQSGDLLRPPTAPGALLERKVDPQMAALARLMPQLVQLDPAGTAKQVMEQFAAPKPMALSDTQRLVNPRTGAPIGSAPPAPPPFTPPPGYEPSYTVGKRGDVSTAWKKPDEVRTPYTRQDIEAELRLEGLTPGTLGWQKRYNDKARQIMVAPGGEIRGAGTGLGGGPLPTPAAPNIGPQPIVPGTEPMPSPPSRGVGGSGALYERPPNPEMATHYLSRNTWQPPPPGMTMSQIQRSGEYVQIPTARVNSLSQGRVVKGMLDELESIIVKRPDLFPVKSTGGGLLEDALSLGKAKGYSLIPGAKDYDPDLARLSSLSITLPSAIKAFGDTANIAVKEREIAEQATGLRPGMQDAALARVDLIRRMINDSIQTAGLPPFPSLRTGRAPAAATMPGQPTTKTPAPQDSRRALDPSGKPGRLPANTDLSKYPGWKWQE